MNGRAEELHCHADQLLRDHLLSSVGRTLERHAVDALVVKGAALAATVYPQPSRRPMCDIDLVVRPQDLARGLRALEMDGAEIEPIPADRRWSFALQGERRTFVRAAGTPFLVELHTTLDRIAPRALDWAGIRARSTSLGDWPRSLRVPAPEDHALLVILHAAVHDFGHAVAWQDLAALWRAGIDEAVFAARAKRWGLALTSYLALSHVAEVVAPVASDALLTRLRPPPWRLALAERALVRARAQAAWEPRWTWTLRQPLWRDEPFRWLAGLARYGAMRAADRASAWY